MWYESEYNKVACYGDQRKANEKKLIQRICYRFNLYTYRILSTRIYIQRRKSVIRLSAFNGNIINVVGVPGGIMMPHSQYFCHLIYAIIRFSAFILFFTILSFYINFFHRLKKKEKKLFMVINILCNDNFIA